MANVDHREFADLPEASLHLATEGQAARNNALSEFALIQ